MFGDSHFFIILNYRLITDLTTFKKMSNLVKSKVNIICKEMTNFSNGKKPDL